MDKFALFIRKDADETIEAQVVGFRENLVLLMARQHSSNTSGCKVISKKKFKCQVLCGPHLLGRIDGMGRPIDGKGPLLAPNRDGLYRTTQPIG